MNSYKKTTFVLTAIAVALSHQAGAAQPAGAQELDPLIISAQRLSQPLSQTLAAATVITRAEIDRLQPASLADLLQGQAGVEIGRTGNALAQTSVFIRGANSNHTLILLNGQKLNDPTSGTASLQFIQLSQIERIEILRGPQSSAWGADALGGVINIITREANQDGLQGEISQSWGADRTWQTGLQLAGRSGATQWNGQLSWAASDGFNAQTADTSGEEDGYQQFSAAGQVAHQLNKDHRLQLTLHHTQGDNDYDGCSDPVTWATSHDCEQEFSLTSAQLAWQAQLSAGWQMQLSGASVLEHREQFREGTANGETKTRRDELQWQHSFTAEDYSASLGVDLAQEKLLEAPSFAEDQRRLWGVYAQGQHQLAEQLIISSGVRFDDDEYFGSHTTGHLGLAWQLSSTYQLGASASSGYRAPNLQELYGAWGANPDLNPEESLNYEAWVAFDNQQGARSRLSFFHNTIDELITWSNSQYQNISEARIRGVELSSQYRLEDWRLGVQLTWQDPENRETGTQLLRRAKQHGRIDIDYLGSNWSLGSSLKAQSSRYDWDGPSLPGYATLHLRAQWDVTPAWQLSTRVDNLLDKDDQLASGYNTQGRYWEARVAYRF
ncbi:TonB-dependent receptor [Marinospirillum sp. MEB164]|uniref:TonB-dependent receptor n=1 Tax=Marinospirillum alkalitolerans TaxID=3123374 RepID=A0ABW8PZT4_9GAMM